MLLAIRERVMGIVGWIILGILCIAFAFFGLNSYLDSDKAIYAASVNGVEISSRQENQAYQRLRKRMEEMMGSSFDPAMIDESQLRKTALRQIINEELLFQEAADGGFASSDQQLAAQINSINYFKTDGKFSKQRYERALANQGMSPAEFEGQLRRGIMSDQLRSGIVKTAAPTPGELELAYRLQGQQRRFSYLILPVSAFRDPGEGNRRGYRTVLRSPWPGIHESAKGQASISRAECREAGGKYRSRMNRRFGRSTRRNPDVLPAKKSVTHVISW